MSLKFKREDDGNFLRHLFSGRESLGTFIEDANPQITFAKKCSVRLKQR